MFAKLTVEQAGNLTGIQASIYGKYGLEAINEAWERLCTKCRGLPPYYDDAHANPCLNYLPLTIEAEDCPYYQERETEERLE